MRGVLMNINLKKWILLFLVMALCCCFCVGCDLDVETNDGDGTSVQSGEETTTEKPKTTTTTKPEKKMDWSIFKSIGVDSSEAETIFKKLGFDFVTDLKPIGTSTINYQMFPYGEEEMPINIMVEGGKITQVTLRDVHVADGARDAYFDDKKLPETWYCKGEKGYKNAINNKIGIVMYDTYMFDGAYDVGVRWEARELYYFD